jgi:exonuclease III
MQASYEDNNFATSTAMASNVKTPTQEPLGLLSLNTNGLGEARKRQSVFQWLKHNHKADKKITFLQETHSTEKTEKLWENEWGHGKLIFSHGSSGSKGTVIIIPDTINYELKETIRSQNGRYVAIHIIIDGIAFIMINCYAPNTTAPKDQLKWLKDIQNILENHSDLNIIIGGDLNDCFIPHLDRYRSKPNAIATEYVNSWKLVCDELNLSDFWRVTNPNKKCYTWRQGSSMTRLKQSRLDYWLVSTHLMFQLENVDIQSGLRSDHSLININFYKSEKPDRGPSYWRFNASLLKDSNYIKQINTCFSENLEKYKNLEDKGLLWDMLKMEMRSSTICFSKNKAKETRLNIKEAVINMEKLEKQLSTNPSEDILIQYHENKTYIENYNNEKANGAIMRSKASWAEFGERNSKIFLNLEKRNHNMKCITTLLNEDTEITKFFKF